MLDTGASTKAPKKRKASFRKASIACVECRKAKTRCYHLSEGSSCLRCKNLSLRCSVSGLQIIDEGHKYQSFTLGTDKDTSVDIKVSEKAEYKASTNTSFSSSSEILTDIDLQLKSLSQRMDLLVSQRGFESSSQNNAKKNTQISTEKTTYQSQLDSLYFNISPFRDITSISSRVGLKFERELGYDLRSDLSIENEHLRYDIVKLGIIDYVTCIQLLEIFKDNYDAWASFPIGDKELSLVLEGGDCPFLIAVCCLLALRHCENSEITEKQQGLSLEILGVINRLLSLSMNKTLQTKEFLQGVLLLSSYSLSLSYKFFYFDGWKLSGHGLIHFITREMNLNLLSARMKSHPDRINNFRIWNHLVLTHLWFCILSGRPCLIDELRLDQCRDILELPAAAGYDGKSVAELSILLSLYNCLQYEESVSVSEKELQFTFKSWEYLCEQKPFGNLILITYKFSRVMLYRRDLLRLIEADDDKDRLNFSLQNGSFEWNQSVEVPIDVICTIIEETSELFDIVSKCDRTELFKSNDTCLFSIFFVILTAIKASRLCEIDKNSKIMLTESVDACLSLCKEIKSKVSFYNGFLDHYRDLLIQFQHDSVNTSPDLS